MFKVMLVDDHSIVRDGIGRYLERAPDMAVVGEAGNGADAVAILLERAVDVCVTDLDMPGGGLAFIQRLRELRPALRILVLSQHGERDFALRALNAGAHGYVNKGASAPAIESAIRQVAQGRRYLSEEAQELAFDRLLAPAPVDAPPHTRLTSRELDVVLQLVRGRRVGEIADEVGISFKTVSTHRSNALLKLGLSGNAELALYAREHGLV